MKPLIAYLLKKENRDRVKAIIDSINIEPPYDAIIQSLYRLKDDIDKEDLIQLIGTKVSPSILQSLKTIPTEVSHTVADTILNELKANSILFKVSYLLRNKDMLSFDKIQQIQELVSTNHYLRTDDIKTKLSTDLKEEKLDSLLFFVYPMSRGEFCLIAGYSGIGKTHLLLSLLRKALNKKLNCLFISIADWSESSLSRVIKQAKNFPPFWVAVYSDCSLEDVEKEVVHVKPDILFLDSMTVIRTEGFTPDKRYLQLGYIAERLKAMAHRYNMLLIASHQLTNNEFYPEAEDLQDAKSHVLAHTDLCLGIGGESWSPEKNITTIKLRHHAVMPTKRIILDFKNLDYEEDE